MQNGNLVHTQENVQKKKYVWNQENMCNQPPIEICVEFYTGAVFKIYIFLKGWNVSNKEICVQPRKYAQVTLWYINEKN